MCLSANGIIPVLGALLEEFGHSLTDLLGSQRDVGFTITDLYEDYMPNRRAKKEVRYAQTNSVKSA
jgi:hypothetical protein